MTRYFEDVTVGAERSFGSYEVTAEEVTDFAERYDPQPFHLDEAAAAASPFGGLIASGWHTAAMTMRLLVDEFIEDAAARGALGVDELRWRRPVRPGDELAVRTEIVDTEPWDEETGLVRFEVTTLADGEVAMTMTPLVLFARRDAADGGD